ncbi:MAG: RtcB family protein [Elusimicrobia bacterium]|nr:RtcB family protein [Elusimicrobiota bacterium]
MKKIIITEKLPIKMWIDEVESGAARQIRNLANLPFAFSHIAIMPDCHSGYGMPIGGVLATRDVIIPNAVGVDIGCGMCAVRTTIKEINKETLRKIIGRIRSLIPLGFEHYKQKQPEILMPERKAEYTVIEREWENALTQIGTLGGGNHFIEIQKGNDGYIWIMIHSGSRNLGKQVADYYNRLAKRLGDKFQPRIPSNFDLAFLPLGTKEGEDYVNEMNFCVKFALNNRKRMMEKICDIFSEEFSGNIKFPEMINIEHNYAKLEKHFGRDVWVHRKGATLASKDTVGIVPGSQGAKSYIVKGLGNPESFLSCAHGAGRKMSRHEAMRVLSVEEEAGRLDKQGILHAIRGKRDLDEAPSAYKNISEVMDAQKDLVEILVELSPLAVIKG